MIYKRFGNGLITTSWDDGHAFDIKVAALLHKYVIPGTFYIAPFYEAIQPKLSHMELVSIARDPLMEIGAHTMTHPILRLISREQRRNEIVGSKQWLEKQIRMHVTSFCYPKGKYNQDVIDDLKDAGFIEARTVDVLNTDKVSDHYRIKTTIHAHPMRREYKDTYWMDIAKEYADKVFNEGGVYHLFGHSWEINDFSLWHDLEELLWYLDKKANAE